MSQLLTMFTTPVVYLALDRFTRAKKLRQIESAELGVERPALSA